MPQNKMFIVIINCLNRVHTQNQLSLIILSSSEWGYGSAPPWPHCETWPVWRPQGDQTAGGLCHSVRWIPGEQASSYQVRNEWPRKIIIVITLCWNLAGVHYLLIHPYSACHIEHVNNCSPNWTRTKRRTVAQCSLCIVVGTVADFPPILEVINYSNLLASPNTVLFF